MATSRALPSHWGGGSDLVQGTWDPHWTTQVVLDLVSLGAYLCQQTSPGLGPSWAPTLLSAFPDWTGGGCWLSWPEHRSRTDQMGKGSLVRTLWPPVLHEALPREVPGSGPAARSNLIFLSVSIRVFSEGIFLVCVMGHLARAVLTSSDSL